MNEIKVNVRGVDYTIKQSFRSYLLYEEITGKQISEIESMKDILNLLYCTFKGCNKTWNYTFDDFIDIVDEDPTIFEKFNEFNVSTAPANKKK